MINESWLSLRCQPVRSAQPANRHFYLHIVCIYALLIATLSFFVFLTQPTSPPEVCTSSNQSSYGKTGEHVCNSPTCVAHIGNVQGVCWHEIRRIKSSRLSNYGSPVTNVITGRSGMPLVFGQRNDPPHCRCGTAMSYVVFENTATLYGELSTQIACLNFKLQSPAATESMSLAVRYRPIHQQNWRQTETSLQYKHITSHVTLGFHECVAKTVWPARHPAIFSVRIKHTEKR